MTNRKDSILTGEALKDEVEQYKGLTIHGNRIRMSFTYKGQRCIENLDDKLTAKNIKAADDKRTAIRHEISRGSFKYEEHFPNSKKTHLFSCKPRTEETLSSVLNRWLEIKKTKLAPSSYKSYHNKSHCHIIPKFGSRKISTILQSEINEWVSKDLHHLSNKTINNILLVLRGCFADAVKDQKLDSSPMEHVEPLKQLENEPDPFSLEEIRAFVNTPTNRVQEVNAFEFSCLTGLRPSEMIALAWEDVDTVNWTLKIDRAKVNNSFKRTKTKSSKRTINLIAPAIDVLKRQMEFSNTNPL
ncbi:Arm DNA-binding domain-containing protein [Thalassotalea fusca]